ncbi:hypothetical protein SMD44_07635 [Streptomyces alboflavus]|uniref:Uncharacterized protein n=1 Tax=Streptomyces alboflavus TaxID=67267 RepID=A0A1Z1WNY7_9ACTN|nr:hypothetical protein SMD44_07635 [Streptomyces alboflavus]
MPRAREHLMSALALSIVLSLISAVAYAGGAIIQEQVAAKSAEQQYAPCATAPGGSRWSSTASAVCCTWWRSPTAR